MNPGLTLGSCGKHRHIDGGKWEITLTIETGESPEQCSEQGDAKRIDGADGKREAETASTYRVTYNIEDQEIRIYGILRRKPGYQNIKEKTQQRHRSG